MSGNDNFLSRWSRLKRKADTQAASPAAEATEAEPQDQRLEEPSPQSTIGPSAPEALSEEELAALPRIEDLTIGSDIRAFMRPGVPSALRNAALRRMWLLTPAVRDYRDPAVDYAWDWNTPGGVPGDGVGPSAERAAEMLRKIVEPRTPQPEETAPESEPLAQVSQPALGEAEGESPPAPAAKHAAPPTETATETATESTAESTAGSPAGSPEISHREESPKLKDNPESSTRRRRHGGALPS